MFPVPILAVMDGGIIEELLLQSMTRRISSMLLLPQKELESPLGRRSL